MVQYQTLEAGIPPIKKIKVREQQHPPVSVCTARSRIVGKPVKRRRLVLKCFPEILILYYFFHMEGGAPGPNIFSHGIGGGY